MYFQNTRKYIVDASQLFVNDVMFEHKYPLRYVIAQWFRAHLVHIVALLVFMLVLAGIIYYIRKNLATWIRVIVSDILATYNDFDISVTNVLREQFFKAEYKPSRIKGENTHALAKSFRDGFDNFVDSFAESIGYATYSVSTSNSDVLMHNQGSRLYYVDKDFYRPYLNDKIKQQHLIKFTDVDYYVDMPAFLAQHANPVIIYTIIPEAVACPDVSKGSFTFDAEGNLKFYVDGSPHYKHRLWNYNNEHLRATKTFCGISYATTCYLVDLKRITEHRTAVLLTPVARFGWFASIILSLFDVEHKLLERLNPVVNGKYLRLRVVNSAGMYVSMGRVDEFSCVKLTPQQDENIAVSARTGVYDLNLTTVASWTNNDRAMAARCFEYYLEGNNKEAVVVNPLANSVYTVQHYVDKYEPDAKPLMVPFMKPLVIGSVIFTNTKAAVEACVEGRIKHEPTAKMNNLLHRMMKDLVRYLIPERWSLVPVEFDYIYDKQNKPTQRNLINQSISWGDTLRNKFTMFLKKEAYTKVTHPRPITIDSPDHKVLYASYLYAFMEHLKQFIWYGPGMNPKQIAERMVAICMSAERGVNFSDFKKMEKHKSEPIAEWHNRLFKRAFHPRYHKEVLMLNASCLNATVVGALGVIYRTVFHQLSGLMNTSSFNTIDNVLVFYIGLRLTKVNGVYLTHEQAIDRLGTYTGDDGATRDIDRKALLKAAKMLGFELEEKEILIGDLGVNYLSRFYTREVWTGNPTSCLDFNRQITKIHLMTKIDSKISDVDKLVAKCIGYYYSDRNTPLFGILSRKVLLLKGYLTTNNGVVNNIMDIPKYLDEVKHRYDNMLTYNVRNNDFENQYPNTAHEDFVEYWLSSAAGQFSDKTLVQAIIQASSLEEMLNLPCMGALPITNTFETPIVINDTIVEPGEAFVSNGIKKKRRTKCVTNCKHNLRPIDCVHCNAYIKNVPNNVQFGTKTD